MGKSVKRRVSSLIKASVNYTQTHFVVTNNDTFDWQNIKMELGVDGYDDPFIFKTETIMAGKTCMVSRMQFVSEDGIKLGMSNAYPETFSISCKTSKGGGLWFGDFD